MKNNLSMNLKTALNSNKKLIATGLAVGMLFSGASAFANTSSTIPATVTVKDTPVLSAAVTPGSLDFSMQRGQWDSKEITIENTGNVDFYPEITYTTVEQEKFDGTGADITTSDKVILKSGDGTIYDFTAPSAYLPNRTTKITNSETLTATVQVGAGENVPQGFVGPSFEVNVNLKQQ